MVTANQILEEFERDGELEVIKRFILDGDIVFDVGGNIGMWSEVVLKSFPKVFLHIFEAASGFQDNLFERFSEMIKEKQVVVNRVGVSNTEGVKDFNFYHSHPALSTLFPRNDEIRSRFKICEPVIRQINTVTIDKYCERNEIDCIDFLKVDVEGGEFDVLLGASNLLLNKKIKCVQFEYGGCFIDAKTTLQSIYELLDSNGYQIFKLHPKKLQVIKEWDSVLEDYVMVNFFALRKGI